MKWQWKDLGTDLHKKDSPPCPFLGGVGGIDLWFSPKNNVIMCQQGHNDSDYVSYSSGKALWMQVTGVLTEELNEKNAAACRPGSKGVTKESPPHRWQGEDNMTDPEVHKPVAIAWYLLMFAPWVFDEKTREEMFANMEWIHELEEVSGSV